MFIHHLLQFYPNLILWVIFPVFIPQSFSLILAFQAAFIIAGIFPIYGIVRYYLKLKGAAMLIAISYLLYPYLSGMYWFDFHYQALFLTIFFNRITFVYKSETQKRIYIVDNCKMNKISIHIF
ncbi:MAG: DUF2079 domain-containing protein [Thermoplasmata archaeon]